MSVIEENGYGWGNLAGTSAGAIVASLLAAGYSAAEMKELVAGVLSFSADAGHSLRRRLRRVYDCAERSIGGLAGDAKLRRSRTDFVRGYHDL